MPARRVDYDRIATSTFWRRGLYLCRYRFWARRAYIDGVTGGVSRRELLATGAAVAAVAAVAPAEAAGATDRGLTRRRHKPPSTKSVGPRGSALPDPKPIVARHSDPADLGVLEAASLLQAGYLSVAELTAACSANRAKFNGPITFDGAPDQINAWIRLYPDMTAVLERGLRNGSMRPGAAGLRRRCCVACRWR
jgi:hypothetical protein